MLVQQQWENLQLRQLIQQQLLQDARAIDDLQEVQALQIQSLELEVQKHRQDAMAMEDLQEEHLRFKALLAGRPYAANRRGDQL